MGVALEVGAAELAEPCAATRDVAVANSVKMVYCILPGLNEGTIVRE